MAKFFIDRPIFAIVIAILIMLVGGLSIVSMPIEQYPTIAPPSIQETSTCSDRSMRCASGSIRTSSTAIGAESEVRAAPETRERNGCTPMDIKSISGSAGHQAFRRRPDARPRQGRVRLSRVAPL